VWLNQLDAAIKTSLRHILAKSIQTYEEKPREKWLLDYPSQIVLVACQIYWTQEVNIAFEQLEENNENAMRDYNKKQIQQSHQTARGCDRSTHFGTSTECSEF